VRYEVGLFAAGAPLTAAAGHFVHVYVDRATRRPAPLPQRLVEALQALQA
jgi:acyl-CoA thioester hydrolase